MQSITKAVNGIRNRQKGLVGGSAVTLVLTVFTIGLRGISSIVAARGLRPEAFGELMYFIATSAAVALFADLLGVRQSATILIAQREDASDRKDIITTLVAYAVAIGLISGFAFAFIPILRTNVFLGYGANWRPLIVFSVLFVVVQANLRSVFVAERNFLVAGLCEAARTLLFLAFMCLAIFAFGRTDVLEIAWLFVVSYAISTLLVAVPLFASGWGRPSWSFFVSSLNTGWRAASANMLGFLNVRADQYLIKKFLTGDSLGQYQLLFSVSQIVSMIPGVIGSVLFPLVAREKDKQKADARTLRVVQIVGGISTLLCLAILPFSEWFIVTLCTEEYRRAGQTLPYLLPAVVFLGILLLLNNHLSGRGYPLSLLASLFVGLVANILLNLYFIPRWDIKGAAMASSISYAVQLAFTWFAFKRSSKGN